MDKEHVKGTFDQAKGGAKKAVGGLTGSNETKAEGHADSAKGAVKKAVGDVKDAAQNLSDKVSHKAGEIKSAIGDKVNQLKK